MRRYCLDDASGLLIRSQHVGVTQVPIKAQELTLSRTFNRRIAKVNLPAGTTVRLTYQLQNFVDIGKFLSLKDWNQNAHSVSSSVEFVPKVILHVVPLPDNDSHCLTKKHP